MPDILVIFAASFEEIGHPRPDELSYFTDYDSAFAFIEAEKQSYFDDEDLKDVQTKARISIVQLNDKNRRDSTWFDFDTDLRMTGLFPCYSGDEDGMDNEGLDMAYIYVPVPFKSVFGNFSFYSYKKACGQKKTVRGSKNSRRLSNGTPAI